MKMPIDKEWFEKRAAAEGDEIGAGGNRKTVTLNLTEEEIAELERLVKPAAPYWRCFHCDEVFYDTHSAKAHFGMDQCSDPACKIKMGAEGSLVTALRRAEAELSDAWAAIHNDSTEAAKAYYAQQSRHGEQLRAAEELGYERGLADGRADPSRQTKTNAVNLGENERELHEVEKHDNERHEPEHSRNVRHEHPSNFALEKDNTTRDRGLIDGTSDVVKPPLTNPSHLPREVGSAD